jgi:HK97 family phage major capsid protein
MSTQAFVNQLHANRAAAAAEAEAVLLRAKSEHRSVLSELEQRKLDGHLADMRAIDRRLDQEGQDLTRTSGVNPALATLTATGSRGRPVSSAGRLAPIGYTEQELRRAFDQVNRGETAVLAMEQRDPGYTSATPLVPPYLLELPIFPRHERRLLSRLPGISIDVPALEYIEVVSTTGTAQIVPEAGSKPELLMPTDQKTATARKIAAHVGVSWEAYSGDFPSFVAAVQTELLRCVTDCENLQLYAGSGDANGQVNGLTSNANILTFAASGTTGTNPNNFDDIAGAIATLRTGPALAEPDLLLLHPDTWASIRTQKAAGTGMYFVAPDPSVDQVEQIWGVDVLQSSQFTAGQGVLLDTTLYGRVVVRESLVTRIGYTGTDFTQNIVRFVSEERITQTIERPQAICKITGLPTAAPLATETKRSK